MAAVSIGTFAPLVAAFIAAATAVAAMFYNAKQANSLQRAKFLIEFHQDSNKSITEFTRKANEEVNFISKLYDEYTDGTPNAKINIELLVRLYNYFDQASLIFSINSLSEKDAMREKSNELVNEINGTLKEIRYLIASDLDIETSEATSNELNEIIKNLLNRIINLQLAALSVATKQISYNNSIIRYEIEKLNIKETHNDPR